MKLLLYSVLLLSLVLLIACKKETYSPVEKKTVVFDIKTNANDDLERQTIDSSLLLLAISDLLLIDFYKKQDNKTIWSSSKNRKELLDEIKEADLEGLLPNDYSIKKLIEFESKTNSLTPEHIVEYDLLLTQNFYKYISTLSNGKLNFKNLYNNWSLKLNPIKIDSLLFIALNNNKVKEIIEQSKPQHIVYRKLKEALATLNELPNDDNLSIIQLKKKKIVQNESNEAIIPIKKRLIYWKDLKSSDSLTSFYDKNTFDAVKRFQKRHGLQDDGVISAGTITALNISKEKRTEQIIVNLERWRWFPRNKGENYLIINIPNFKLDIVEGKDTVGTHRVIVGTYRRETPVLSSKLNYIVYNPTWTVPPTILREDLIPATSKNTSYLSSKNITIYDKKNHIVNIKNWRAEDASSYRYVQSLGDYNSLGRVKIIFPNPFLVYLHDTNNHSLFNKSNRSISSGCVRLENPVELTEYLLSDTTDWDREKINRTLESKKTISVTITKNINIHILYWTAWMDHNELQFRNDIYKMDTDLYKKLRE